MIGDPLKLDNEIIRRGNVLLAQPGLHPNAPPTPTTEQP